MSQESKIYGMREKIEIILKKVLGAEYSFDLSVPPRSSFGHYSTNIAMKLAKEEGKNPLILAKEFAEKLKEEAGDIFQNVEAVPPGFINFWLTDEAIRKELRDISKNKKNFGKKDLGKGKRVIIEYSQPNIAKRMHVGHIRSTILGDVLANCFDELGYKVIRWNYLGDWGTQFGKLIAAYKLWGSEEEVKKAPIETLLKLYVRFHDEMKEHPELEESGREEFKKLEDGDTENRNLWEWFKEESLIEFNKIYETLKIKFDVELGEAFFEKDMRPLFEELKKRGIAKKSEGGWIVPLDEYDLPPALVWKSDDASLYLTRDIANLRYRIRTYDPSKIIYVVGNEQSLHFDQLFKIAEILDIKNGVDLRHVKFGLVLAESGQKLATREGRVVFLEDVINRSIELARAVIEEKNKGLPEDEKEKIAKAVGVGALKYAVLKENPRSDIVFDWSKILDFTGDSGPYLQYTYARLRSIRRKAGMFWFANLELLTEAREMELIRKMSEFPHAIQVSAETDAPNHLTNYLYELANLINGFYETTPILKDANTRRRNARLILIETAAFVLKKGMNVLGIDMPEKI